MSHFHPIALDGYIGAMATKGIVTVPDFLREDSREGLLCELEGRYFAQEPEEKGPYNVRQQFSAITTFPTGSRFFQIRFELEQTLSGACELAGVTLSGHLRFTDMVVQRYEPCPEGISVHRDGESFINLIAILVLEGEGKFYRHEDRDGRGPQEIRNEPGDMLLMRGPGFLGADIQPFHSVGTVISRRTSLSLRQKQKKS